jgi:hypothetical protein
MVRNKLADESREHTEGLSEAASRGSPREEMRRWYGDDGILHYFQASTPFSSKVQMDKWVCETNMGSAILQHKECREYCKVDLDSKKMSAL